MCIVKGQYRQIILAAVCVQFNGIKVFDEWTAEGRKAWTSGSHQTLARPLCVNHSDESWNRLSHVELMDRWGWEQGAADPTPQKHSSSHQCWQYTQTHTQNQGGKKSRNTRWASNQRTLQQLNQYCLSDEEEHFWFLWAAAFINHPQKKHHSTTTWVEHPLFCSV